jgi:hypothetical protein
MIPPSGAMSYVAPIFMSSMVIDMTDNLRETARTRWRQNNEGLRRREAMRRMWSLFFLSLAVTLCGLLSVKIVAQHVTAHDRAAIEGALHGQ